MAATVPRSTAGPEATRAMAVTGVKAAVNRAQSKRFAPSGAGEVWLLEVDSAAPVTPTRCPSRGGRIPRQRLECTGFSPAFPAGASE
jgi:hypothetical protein